MKTSKRKYSRARQGGLVRAFERLRHSRTAKLSGLALILAAANVKADVLFSEDFEGLPLKPAQSPTEIGNPAAWTDVPPAGWVRDNLTTPIGDPVEFQGWTFVNKDWWVATSGDQERSQFTTGSGTVAVADPDEYDDGTDVDGTNPAGLFNASLRTPGIDLSGVEAGSVVLSFDSSFRAETPQIAILDVSFDNGASFSEILKYDSNLLPDGDLITGPLSFPLSNPSGGTLIARWSLVEAGNDWWWAIDNVQVEGRIPGTPTVPEALNASGALGMAFGLMALIRRKARK